MTLTNMCMVYQGSKVLVEDRVDPNWHGVTFPGGHVERGEPFTDAVKREMLEETGLTIHAPRLCGVKDWIQDDGSRYMVLLYKTDRFEGEIRSSAEGKIGWVELSALPSLETTPDMKELLQVFLNDELSEFCYDREGGGWIPVLK